MQTTLFKNDKRAESAPLAPKEAHGIGEFFADLFARYCEMLDRHATEMESLASLERNSCPCVEYIDAINAVSEHSVNNDKLETARRIRDRLVHHASKVFAPAGTPLKIETRDLDDPFFIEKGSLESFDPVRLWRLLEEKYGGRAGVDEAWRQAAQKIIYSFNLRKDSEVKHRGNFLVLDHRVYIDSIDKKFYKENRLHYNCREELQKVLICLSSFAQWCGRDLLAIDLKRLSEQYLGYGKEAIESHKQHLCGEGEFAMVTFTTRFEFRFRRDVGEQLQQFLGLYGTCRD